MQCDKKSACNDYFLRGESACAKCALCHRAVQQAIGETVRQTTREYTDEVGGEETHTDDYGNGGARLYEVEVRLRRTSELDRTYTVAADDEDEARERAEELAWGEDDSEWDVFDDDAEFESVEEVEDNDE